MATENQLKAWENIINRWEKTPGHNIALTENNMNVLRDALARAIQQGTSPSIQNWVDLVYQERAAGRLTLVNPPQTVERVVYQQVVPQEPPAPTDPADTLPHAHIPQLAHIKTLADIRKMSVDEARKWAQPGVPFKKEYQERVAYIVEHQIVGKKTEASTEPTVQKSAGQIEAEALISQMESIKASVTRATIGTVTSWQGRWQKVATLHAKIDQEIAAARSYAWVSQVKEALQRVKDLVANEESASVR
jgi:hypothetical protein